MIYLLCADVVVALYLVSSEKKETLPDVTYDLMPTMDWGVAMQKNDLMQFLQ